MITQRTIMQKRDALISWLGARGAEVLEPTNEWELLRFRAGTITSVVYRNKAGNVTYTGEAQAAVTAFMHGNPWRAVSAKRRRRTSPLIRTLRARDGDCCFACGFYVPEHDESVDHLVEVTCGGPSHLSNYVLMHVDCNGWCAGMSAPEKVRMHLEIMIALEGL